MGAELVRIKDKNIFCVFDNTIEETKTFHNFDSCTEAFKHFGRNIGAECSEDYVIEFFETEVAEILNEKELESELEKIAKYFIQEASS